MCKVMEYYLEIARNEGRAEGRAEVRAEKLRMIADELSKKDEEIARLRAQIAALTQKA